MPHKDPEARKAYANEYRRKNRERVRKWNDRNPHWRKMRDFVGSLRRNYSISLARYLAILSHQDERCAICRGCNWGTRHNTPQVDHCHTTGNVRGILCFHCNRKLGECGDTLEAIQDTFRKQTSYLASRKGAF